MICGQCDGHMLRPIERFCALWLVAQILLPFTAPFPICDLPDLLASAPHHGTPFVSATPRVDGDYAIAPPLATTAGRLRLVVVSSPDVTRVFGSSPLTALGRPVTVAVGESQRSQIQPTVLRL